jgi:hypothetical protein
MKFPAPVFLALLPHMGDNTVTPWYKKFCCQGLRGLRLQVAVFSTVPSNESSRGSLLFSLEILDI